MGVLGIAPAGPLRAQEVPPELTVELRGRIHLDAARHFEDGDVGLGDGTTFRRARLGVNGSIQEDWAFRLEVDVSGNRLQAKDLWVGWSPEPATRVRLGHFREPFGLEHSTSSNDLTFLERALPSEAFGPDRQIGAAVWHHAGPIFLSGGIFGEGVDQQGSAPRGDEGWGVTGRVAWTLQPSGDRVVHVGLSGTRRTPPAGGEVVFRSRPETAVDGTRFLHTGAVGESGSFVVGGLAAAAQAGPVSIQGELLRTRVHRDAAIDAELGGEYVFASWLPFGGTRPYVPGDARFARPRPGPGLHGLELGVRWSRLDLDDPGAGVTGGEARQWTVGVTWPWTSWTRFMVNWVRVDQEATADADGSRPAGRDFEVLTTRIQLTF